MEREPSEDQVIRWGQSTLTDINEKIASNIPKNTKKSKEYAWRQFMDFCSARGYSIDEHSSVLELSNILKDYAYNMKRRDGKEYKEVVVKFNWNVTAKLLQEKFYNEYHRKIDPFTDIEFKHARNARDAKRKELQHQLEKRKRSSDAFTLEEHIQLQKYWSEDTPEGLQKKFYFICAKELAWRGNEGVNAKLHFFHIEKDNVGNPTGRIEYNPIFNKTNQGGSKSCCETKWLVQNTTNTGLCPVRLFQKILEKRPMHITCDRLFLTPNMKWRPDSGAWYKNLPVGVNTMSKWTSETAKKVGFDIENKKFTNHSHRASAVTHLAQAEISEQELMKITGHNNSNSLKPYLNMQSQRHTEIVNKLRVHSSLPSDITDKQEHKSLQNPIFQSAVSTSINNNNEKTGSNIVFENCTFHVQNFHCNEL